MRFGALLLLAGCQNLFGLHDLPADSHAADAARDVAIASTDAPDDARVFLDSPGRLIALVQHSSNSNTGAGLDVTMQLTPNSGDMLIVDAGAACGLLSISGGGVGTWLVAADSEVSPTNTMFFGVTDGSSSDIRLVPKCTTQTWGLVSEWSGLDSMMTAPDGTNHLGQSTSVAGSVDLAVYPANAPDLLIFSVSSYGPIGSPSMAWTELDPVMVGSITQRAWYQIATASGQHIGDVSISSDYDATIAGFRLQ